MKPFTSYLFLTVSQNSSADPDNANADLNNFCSLSLFKKRKEEKKNRAKNQRCGSNESTPAKSPAVATESNSGHVRRSCDLCRSLVRAEVDMTAGVQCVVTVQVHTHLTRRDSDSHTFTATTSSDRVTPAPPPLFPPQTASLLQLHPSFL